jgi:polysaccharide deacetylase 2 family uncharacterized protein YibQ
MKALAITASILLSALALLIAVLAFFPGSDAGEPVAILELQPAVRPAAPSAPAAPTQGATPSGAPQSGEQFAPPPGFIISVPPSGGAPGAPAAPGAPPAAAMPEMPPATPQAQQPAAPPTPAPPPQGALEGSDTQASATPAPTMQQVAAAGPDTASDATAETGSIPLPPVPIAELVEQSQYGPLPKVAADGTRPLEAYARPSRYAAKAAAGGPVRVAVLVNGMGLSDSATGEAIKDLPAPISVAYGAYGRNLQDGVNSARAAGHEVLLQVPLEPMNYPTADPGPHTLLTTLPTEENMKRLQWLMSRFTGYVGVTNLMGAKFEATQNSLLPVLEEIKARGLLYLDDGMVKNSTAGQIAGPLGLDYSVANMQIDGAQSLAKLEALAKERGIAIGVASAKPATVKQLAEWAHKLEAKGIVLVPVSAAVRSQRPS